MKSETPRTFRKQNPAVRYAVEMDGKQIREILRFDSGTPAESVRQRDRWVADAPDCRAPRTAAQVAAQIRRTRARHGESATWLPAPAMPGEVLRLNLDRHAPLLAIPSEFAGITQAEARVLQFMAHSPYVDRDDRIAAEFGIERQSASNLMASIRRKTGLSDRAAMADAWLKATSKIETP